MFEAFKRIFSKIVRYLKPKKTVVPTTIKPNTQEFVQVAKALLLSNQVNIDQTNSLLNEIKIILERTDDALSEDDYAKVSILLNSRFNIPMISAQRLPTGHIIPTAALEELNTLICPYTNQVFKLEDVQPCDVVSVLSMHFFNEHELAKGMIAGTANSLTTLNNILDRIIANESKIYSPKTISKAKSIRDSILRNIDRQREVENNQDVLNLLNKVNKRLLVVSPVTCNLALCMLGYFIENRVYKAAFEEGSSNFHGIQNCYKEDTKGMFYVCKVGGLRKDVAPLGLNADYHFTDEKIKKDMLDKIYLAGYLPVSLFSLMGSFMNYIFFLSNVGYRNFFIMLGSTSMMGISILALIPGLAFPQLASTAIIMGFTQAFCNQNPNSNINIRFDIPTQPRITCSEAYPPYLDSGLYKEENTLWLYVLLSTAIVINLPPLFVSYLIKRMQNKIAFYYNNIETIVAQDLQQQSQQLKHPISSSFSNKVSSSVRGFSSYLCSWFGSSNRFNSLEEPSPSSKAEIEMTRLNQV